jgi:hypothetical protein
MMEGPGADSEEKHEPVSDIDTAVVVVGLKALDPEWPIREAIGEVRTRARSAAGWTRSRMRRGDYIVFDRYHLGYLNALEKLNCAYCSYANGLIAYVREIAGRTEQYWCSIKHARRVIGAHSYYAQFHDYGDAAAFRLPSK